MPQPLLRLMGVKDTLTSLKKINTAYRKAIIISLASSVDRIRARAAREFIIPKLPSLKKEMRPYALRKAQPSHPTKLTERKGILKKMLLEDTEKSLAGSWIGTKSGSIRTRLRLKTGALQGIVKVSGGFGTDKEIYEATLRANITSTSRFISKRNTKSSKEDEQTLFMRFRHETGIRGSRRPFVEPATMKEQFNTTRLIDEKLGVINRL